MRLLYAFNHAESIRAFREAARLDPSLAMAYWGQALALGPSLNAPMTRDNRRPADGDKHGAARAGARARRAAASRSPRAVADRGTGVSLRTGRCGRSAGTGSRVCRSHAESGRAV